MEDKKAKFLVYVVIALIAFVCSSAVYSMTGGLSDWIVASMDDNQDKNNNGYLDSSEDNGLFSFLGSDDDNDGNDYKEDYKEYKSYSDDGNDWGELIDKAFNKIFDSDSSSSSSYYSSSSSDDNPDIIARFLRFFVSNG